MPDETPINADRADLLVYRDDRGRERPVRDAAEWRLRREQILASMQRVMGTLPDPAHRVPLAVETLEEARLPGFRRRRITFAAEAGDRVPAYLFLPDGVTAGAPAMLIPHPTGARGKDQPAGLVGPETTHFAPQLARRGYVALAPDYPGSGDYACDPYALGYVSATMKGVWNHIRAIDLLQSLPEADPERIGAIGHSLGGHNSIFVAAFDPRVRAVVSSCGFNAFPKYFGGDLTGWSHRGYMPRIADVYGRDPAHMPFDFPEVIAALAPRAFFTNSPVDDDNFEVSGVRDCIAAARSVYALLGAEERLVAAYPAAGHDFPDETRALAYNWLDRQLRAA
ncbi:MAG: dienelactone hydrolase family protein [Chthonomonadales bacterium]|nr:dienelactone hydrolase family protein [Chthonomonadales bacterium]